MYVCRLKGTAKQFTVISISTKTKITSNMPPDTISLSLFPLLLAMWHSSLLVPPFWRDDSIATTLPLKSCSLTDIGTCKEKQPVTGSSSISSNLPWWNLYRSRTSAQLFFHPFTVDHATSWSGRQRIVCKPFEQWKRIQGVGFRWIDPQLFLKFDILFGLSFQNAIVIQLVRPIVVTEISLRMWHFLSLYVWMEIMNEQCHAKGLNL